MICLLSVQLISKLVYHNLFRYIVVALVIYIKKKKPILDHNWILKETQSSNTSLLSSYLKEKKKKKEAHLFRSLKFSDWGEGYASSSYPKVPYGEITTGFISNFSSRWEDSHACWLQCSRGIALRSRCQPHMCTNRSAEWTLCKGKMNCSPTGIRLPSYPCDCTW